jgi:glucose-6-phosphate 1-dehydrogenase
MASSDSSTADLLVIFGITGDLAMKMTFRALYRLEARELLGFPIIGVAGDDISADQLIAQAHEAIIKTGQNVNEAVFARLARRISYLHGDVTQGDVYGELAAKAGGSERPLYYLEVPPTLFAPIVEQLGGVNLLRDGRVAVEKPFGHDLASARELNARLHRWLREDQIFRIDHFLAKEPVIDIAYLRFANTALAELWDRRTVAAIQITMAEDFGVEDRGRFYDPVGALRDVVQNHLLQVLALVAMDAPAGASASDVQDKKVEVFRSIPAADPEHYVRGQYAGYTNTPGVAPGSTTETFAALRLEIDSFRWADVPIFIRAGKELPRRVTEVRLLLRRTPRLAALQLPMRGEPNQIVVRIDPDPGLRIELVALGEDTWRPVHLDTLFSRELGPPMEPYERLLHAAIVGDHQLFTREDGVEETWRIVQPLLDNPPDVLTYTPGSWGPAAADTLVRGRQRWQEPWLTSNA